MKLWVNNNNNNNNNHYYLCVEKSNNNGHQEEYIVGIKEGKRGEKKRDRRKEEGKEEGEGEEKGGEWQILPLRDGSFRLINRLVGPTRVLDVNNSDQKEVNFYFSLNL